MAGAELGVVFWEGYGTLTQLQKGKAQCSCTAAQPCCCCTKAVTPSTSHQPLLIVLNYENALGPSLPAFAILPTAATLPRRALWTAAGS
jgi:hypothetical protein